jgi:hypothetical protein
MPHHRKDASVLTQTRQRTDCGAWAKRFRCITRVEALEDRSVPSASQLGLDLGSIDLGQVGGDDSLLIPRRG